jgi:flagellar hook protein FlgE
MSLGCSLQTGVSALKSFTEGLEVIGNNISNVSTTAYKKGRADYGDSFYNILQNSSSASAGITSQTGGGVHLSGISTSFATEEGTYTGQESDLAIDGNGFFRVVDPSSGQEYYTRSGNFTRDNSGYLVTPEGYRLQGTGTLSGSDILVPETATNPTTGEVEAISSWSFSATTGELSLYFSDGTALDAGQLQLSRFSSPSALVRQGGNMFLQTAAAGDRTDFLPSSTESASVMSQYLEQSNVDLTEEFASMIMTQRGFQAGSRIITTTDQLLQEAIQLKK